MNDVSTVIIGEFGHLTRLKSANYEAYFVNARSSYATLFIVKQPVNFTNNRHALTSKEPSYTPMSFFPAFGIATPEKPRDPSVNHRNAVLLCDTLMQIEWRYSTSEDTVILTTLTHGVSLLPRFPPPAPPPPTLSFPLLFLFSLFSFSSSFISSISSESVLCFCLCLPLSVFLVLFFSSPICLSSHFWVSASLHLLVRSVEHPFFTHAPELALDPLIKCFRRSLCLMQSLHSMTLRSRS